MPGRTIAIGDIHGCTPALEAVLGAIDPQPNDTIVTLGDYVDRGADVPGTIERLIRLADECQLVSLLGNHDEMLLEIRAGKLYLLPSWLSFGGDATLQAYRCEHPDDIPEEHIAFLEGCRPWYETDTHFFVHGNYRGDLPLEAQTIDTLFWESLRDRQPGPHRSGKTAILGHTSQKDGHVYDLGYLKCIDTYCYGDGWLTAMDVNSGQIWQADKEGWAHTV